MLQADGDLGQPAVLVIDRIADQLQLGAKNILVEGKTLAQLQRRAGRLSVEGLPGVRKLQPVEQADRDARRQQLIIGQTDIGMVQQ